MSRYSQKGADNVTQIQISGQESRRFSGQDEALFDFPVKNRKRFSGQFFGDLGFGLLYFWVALCGLGAGVVLAVALGAAVLSLYQAFNAAPVLTTLGTATTLAAYAGAVAFARRIRRKHERGQGK